MRQCLCLALVSVVLVLTACTLAAPPKSLETPETSETLKTPATLATPERVSAVEKCLGISLMMVEAWFDRDGNGNRDPDDDPLLGVRFRKECENMGPYYLTSDATGHATLKVVGCCGGQFVPETPDGYRLTKVGAECKIEQDDWFCNSYGFAPTTP